MPLSSTQDLRPPQESTVIVGMSGGVDSSVAAHLLIKQGYTVVGMFMKNWEEDDTQEYCAAASDLKDASNVCERLGIDLHEVNFAHEYWDNVFEHFLSEYAAGRTPNPDILCNKEIKFKEFLLQAETLGAHFIATGHYAARGSCESESTLLKGIDANKDQSYFLYTMQQHQLNKSLFPLGELEKPAVRAIAESQGLITHNKKDSTGICFIGERRFKDFLSTYLKPNPGNMVDTNNKIVGTHDGLMYYTLGQRHGLNIGGPGQAWYVAAKDINTNELLVVQGHDHPAMQTKTVTAKTLDWVSDTPPEVGERVTAKTRYRQSDQSALIKDIEDDKLTLEFDFPQRAVTPGQALVVYQERQCLGGGTIEHSE